jgi:hypothetical protein
LGVQVGGSYISPYVRKESSPGDRRGRAMDTRATAR